MSVLNYDASALGAAADDLHAQAAAVGDQASRLAADARSLRATGPFAVALVRATMLRADALLDVAMRLQQAAAQLRSNQARLLQLQRREREQVAAAALKLRREGQT